MKKTNMANEPVTKQKRSLEVTLQNIGAFAQVSLVNKEDGTDIMKAQPEPIDLGLHRGSNADESDVVKTARDKCVDAIEGALADFYITVNA